ncbi:MAG: hypothetical protein IJW63_10285 [Lachnospiraceae bacterium]|nr:hypothetical protein [Lachnospiraceae bacterium]
MNCCALLFLLLIFGSGNCSRQGCNNGCNARVTERNQSCGCARQREREEDCGCNSRQRERETDCGCNNRQRERESDCGCNNANQRERESDCGCQNVRTEETDCGCDNAGIIPPPWVRVDGGRDNNQSCGCNRR